MSETFDQSEPVQWYEITIGGKKFNIASRHGESHIRKLELLLGFSHPITMELPPGIQAEVVDMRKINLTSHDNVLLGQTAANIRAFRPPEPFQGKGVLYENERIRRKAGKSGKK